MFRSFCYHKHCVKRVRIRSYSGLHFSRIFPHSYWIRRNISPYSVWMRENVRKTRITPNTNTIDAVKKTHLNRNICLIFSACLLQEWSLIINIFSKSVSVIQAEFLRHGFHLERLLVLCENCQETTRKRTKVQMLFCTFCKYAFRTAEPRSRHIQSPVKHLRWSVSWKQFCL